MNTIKYTNFDIYNTPQTVILNKNNEIITLNKVKYVKYFDKIEKKYRHLPEVYKINNNYYA
jgi:hypothetical protein